MGRLVDGGASSARRGCLGMVGGDATEICVKMK